MKFLSGLFFASYFLLLYPAKAQVDTAFINVVSDSLYNNYLRFNLAESNLGYEEIADINLQVLFPDNNYISKKIRQLLLTKEFSSEKQLFNWLLPECNKKALDKFYAVKNPLIIKYANLFEKINTFFCNTYKEVSYHNNSDSVNYYFLKKAGSDSVLLNEHKKILESLNDDDKIKFSFSEDAYIKTHCYVYFDQLTALLKSDEFVLYYNKNVRDFKIDIFLRSIKFYHDKKTDSLKQIFPNYNQCNKELSFLNTIYINSDSGKKINLWSEEVYSSDTLTRISTYFLENNTGKTKIKCQAVFEIDITNPEFYLKNIKIYPREKLQNIQKLDADMEKYMNGYKPPLESDSELFKP